MFIYHICCLLGTNGLLFISGVLFDVTKVSLHVSHNYIIFQSFLSRIVSLKNTVSIGNVLI